MKTTRTCDIAGCDTLVGPKGARGMCHNHYDGMRKRGAFEVAPRLSPTERLKSGLVVMPNGCIEWTRSTVRGGYGQIKVNGKQLKTHRFAWELVNGPIPEGLEVCHHCDNPPCCNVEKCLFLGTAADNMADRDAKGHHGQSKKTHCIHRHPFDEANTYMTPRGARSCRACKRDRREVEKRRLARVEAA